MADRRSISEGLKATPNPPVVDPAVAREFIHGGNTAAKQSSQGASVNGSAGQGVTASAPSASTATAPTPHASSTLTRVPISTRIREDFAKALKRASLQRQLDGQEPNTLQDILEEAVEPWLRNHKYFP